ncbi:hypothetical protein, partial [Bifidobacterium panos]
TLRRNNDTNHDHPPSIVEKTNLSDGVTLARTGRIRELVIRNAKLLSADLAAGGVVTLGIASADKPYAGNGVCFAGSAVSSSVTGFVRFIIDANGSMRLCNDSGKTIPANASFNANTAYIAQ